MKAEKTIVAPCPYMLFNKDGYHECVLFPKGILCAWYSYIFFSEESCTAGVLVNRETGKVLGYKIPLSKEGLTKDDVQTICPRGLTYNQIYTKIKDTIPSSLKQEVTF